MFSVDGRAGHQDLQSDDRAVGTSSLARPVALTGRAVPTEQFLPRLDLPHVLVVLGAPAFRTFLGSLDHGFAPSRLGVEPHGSAWAWRVFAQRTVRGGSV